MSDLDTATHKLVSDLQIASPRIFWTDLLGSVAFGWLAFAAAWSLPQWSFGAIVAGLISGLAFYRALSFTHEITHLRRRSVPGFETTWNLLIGVPFLLPSFTYVGVHQSHHSLQTYGTKGDPEYLPLACSRRMLYVFAAQSAFLLPLLLAIRFWVLAPVGLVWPRFHRFLEAHASSFAMNPEYRRVVNAAGAAKMRRWELVTFVVWAVTLGAMAGGVVPWRALLLWGAIVAWVSFLNTLRVLGAHEYESNGQSRDRRGQLEDSIDTPGGPWTELWAPVGLRYHALHHYFPGIPYHNLGTAYARIMASAACRDEYGESSSPSLRTSLTILHHKAASASAQDLVSWTASHTTDA